MLRKPKGIMLESAEKRLTDSRHYAVITYRFRMIQNVQEGSR